jgi:MFS family permease
MPLPVPYAGYFFGQYPCGWLIGRFPAQRVLGISCFLWGVMVLIMTQCRSYSSARKSIAVLILCYYDTDLNKWPLDVGTTIKAHWRSLFWFWFRAVLMGIFEAAVTPWENNSFHPLASGLLTGFAKWLDSHDRILVHQKRNTAPSMHLVVRIIAMFCLKNQKDNQLL